MLFGLFGKPAAAAIRPARGADSFILSRLHRQGFDRPWGESEFEALIADRSVLGHVACVQGAAPIGFILSRLAADEAEVLSIVVERRNRGQGLARAILRQHMETLIRQRIRKLFLEVEAENEPAIRLYRRLSFNEIGRRKSYYRKADGSTADAIMMGRDL